MFTLKRLTHGRKTDIGKHCDVSRMVQRRSYFEDGLTA